MIRIPIAMRSPTDVNDAINEGQGRALIFAKRIKREDATDAAGAGARISGADDGGAVAALESGGDIQRVQLLDEVRAEFFRPRHHIQRGARGIDYRCSNNAEMAADVAKVTARCVEDIVGRGSDDVGPQKTGLPIRINHRWIVRIKSIDGIVDGRDDHEVMHALPENTDVGHDEGLRIDLIVD